MLVNVLVSMRVSVRVAVPGLAVRVLMIVGMHVFVPVPVGVRMLALHDGAPSRKDRSRLLHASDNRLRAEHETVKQMAWLSAV